MSENFFEDRRYIRHRIMDADDTIDRLNREYRDSFGDPDNAEPLEATDEMKRKGGATVEITVSALWLAAMLRYLEERAETAEREL